MNTDWNYVATIFDGEKFEIQGLNIWDFEWKSTDEKINIKDPLFGKNYSFDIYKIQTIANEIVFAAGEFSNNVWGIYLKYI
jgi:hypothetical protein